MKLRDVVSVPIGCQSSEFSGSGGSMLRLAVKKPRFGKAERFWVDRDLTPSSRSSRAPTDLLTYSRFLQTIRDLG
jgi:hypothetical protein